MYIGGVCISNKFTPCLVCGKNVSNPNQKYCKYCSIRFNTDERNALIGINEGKFNLSLANELLKLKNEGMQLEDIANKVNLLDGYQNITPGIIDPIIRFLINHEADDVLESYQNYLKGVKIKFCEVCNEEFIEPKKVNGQKICKACRKKYTSVEIIVLKGIKEGKYNENTAINAYTYRKMGLSNKTISEKLKIPSNLVSPIIDLLLPERFGGKNRSMANVSNSKSKSKNKTDISKLKHKKICKYCGDEFSTKNSSLNEFCSSCNRKYEEEDLLLFIGIKEGKYSFKLACEIFKLRKRGASDEVISEKVHVPKNLINKILNHFGFDGETINTSKNLANCSVCGNLFVMAKGISNQQYCPSCKEQFTSPQRIVLAGINKGIYNKKLAIRIKDLLDKGESKTNIMKKFKLSSTSVINPIIEYLYDDKLLEVMDKNSLTSSDSDNSLLITDCSGNQTNIQLKCTISNDFALNFLNTLSQINFSIKKITLKDKEGDIEFAGNFDVKDSYLDILFSELIDIGFE